MLNAVKAIFSNVGMLAKAKDFYEAYAEQTEPHPKVVQARTDILPLLYKEFDDEIDVVEIVYDLAKSVFPATATKKEVCDAALLFTLFASSLPDLFKA